MSVSIPQTKKEEKSSKWIYTIFDAPFQSMDLPLPRGNVGPFVKPGEETRSSTGY